MKGLLKAVEKMNRKKTNFMVGIFVGKVGIIQYIQQRINVLSTACKC